MTPSSLRVSRREWPHADPRVRPRFPSGEPHQVRAEPREIIGNQHRHCGRWSRLGHSLMRSSVCGPSSSRLSQASTCPLDRGRGLKDVGISNPRGLIPKTVFGDSDHSSFFDPSRRSSGRPTDGLSRETPIATSDATAIRITAAPHVGGQGKPTIGTRNPVKAGRLNAVTFEIEGRQQTRTFVSLGERQDGSERAREHGAESHTETIVPSSMTATNWACPKSDGDTQGQSRYGAQRTARRTVSRTGSDDAAEGQRSDD
ncbi:MAG: hypothetical protein Udaeo2_21520 [Candidatus Udaeobacter sp.]|nr:MAG: hypothetical protein Udaeo2_21520 [Candidatus Udaeobacter sp.]